MEHLNLQLGCDLLYMPRMKKHMNHEIFLNRILSHAERELYNKLKSEKRKLEFLCGRFAAKEAYAKALGCGIGEVDFQDFEILKDINGKPIAKNAQVSISHDGDYTMAVVILYDEI